MIVTFPIPDELYAQYAAFNPSNPRQALQKQLERFKEVETKDRVLLVRGEALRQLEALHGVPLEDPTDLVKWVEKLAHLKIGDAMVPLREGVRKRLETEAAFYKKPTDEYIRERAVRALDEVLGAY